MKLTVSSTLHKLIEIETKEGCAKILYCRDGVENDTRKWLDWGLNERIPYNENDRSQGSWSRHTDCYEPEFLSRLKAYIEKYFKFTCILED